MDKFMNDFIDSLIKGIPNLLTALAIFIFGIYFAGLLRKFINRVLRKRSAPESVTQLLAQSVYGIIVIVAMLTALQRFFDVTAFITGLGILGFTIGFALQDVMKNFAAGVILLIQRPFEVNEAIGVSGFDGTVLQINLRSTEIKATDGRLVHIPNANILSSPIINYTRADHRRVDVAVKVSRQTDIDTARRTALEAVLNIPGLLTEPTPLIGFSDVSDTTLELSASFWIDTLKTDPAAAKDTAFSLIKNALGK